MFDLSALDAELDALGRAPENVAALAHAYAGLAPASELAAQLAQVDAALSALGDPAQLPVPVARPEPLLRVLEQAAPVLSSGAVATEPEPDEPKSELRESVPRAPALTESQEIVLPDPIAREELSSESGELRLDGNEPSSGSFELPDSPTEPRITPTDATIEEPAPQESRALLPFDDVQDALEGSQPLAVVTRATLKPETELERDPDAEFDALLSEATDPRGIPTLGGNSSEVVTDDLLRGLEGDELADDEVSIDDNAPHEADLLTRSLYEEATGDNTDILDRATLGALESPGRNQREPPPDNNAADELDSGELELLVDDEPTLAPQPTPLDLMPPKPATARPGLSNKAPPPPPPPSARPDKRPSSGLLGRLFTKRDGE